MRTSKKLNPHMTSPPQEFEPNSCQNKSERLNLYIKWDEIYQMSVWDMTLLVSCAVTSFEMAAIEEFSWNFKLYLSVTYKFSILCPKGQQFVKKDQQNNYNVVSKLSNLRVRTCIFSPLKN